MAKVILRNNNRERRKLRVKKKIHGTSEMPRLSVFRSNKYIYAQLIDDRSGKTLLGVSLSDIKKVHEKDNKSSASYELGKFIANKALGKKIKQVVFDRNGIGYR